MHLVTIEGQNPLGIGPGEYLAENVSAGEMLACGYAATVEGRAWYIEFFPDQDWNGKSILFVRPGGFGDLLFLTPTFAEIKRRWPEARIYVACFDRYQPVLLNNPDVDGFVAYPVPLAEWEEFEAHVWLEGLIEKSVEAEKIHAVDLVAARCGLDLRTRKIETRFPNGDLHVEITQRQRMRYFVSNEEAAAAREEFPRGSEPDGHRQARVGIQVCASGRCRTYPHILEVAKLLWRDGHEVFLFGAPGEVKTNETDGVVNLMALNKTFRESCAILDTCDCLVAPDSALTHVAGALGLPCVALYGPFPWALRTKYALETFALQGVCPVSPCFHHARPGTREFPEHGPCTQTGRCEALAAIPAARVCREVSKKLESRKAKVEKGELASV